MTTHEPEGRGPRDRSRDGIATLASTSSNPRAPSRRPRTHHHDLRPPPTGRISPPTEPQETSSTNGGPNQLHPTGLITSLGVEGSGLATPPRDLSQFHPADQRGYSEQNLMDHVTLVHSVTKTLEENERLNLMDKEGSHQDEEDGMELEEPPARTSVTEVSGIPPDGWQEAKHGALEQVSSPSHPINST
ncbi:hypothetical protein J5N97_023096 [Dioscorea zingiberensis]|uniref:Uncharacterized protein n=1 Tax=Dioscorea zingiberensis TaxID=325984 RepID=A0A9D5HB90_9LILI|nr:hypothetical protein J5N97_023096 [Dioscorea zingiberensis]